MNYIVEICELLEQKKQLFQEYEKATSSLKECDIDDMENYITTRAQLAIKIDNLTEKIEGVIESLDNVAILKPAVLNKCARGDLPDELLCVYDLAQATIAIISRISDMNEYLICHMHETQEDLKEKIKASNNTPKINRYLTNLSIGDSNGSMLGDKYSKV